MLEYEHRMTQFEGPDLERQPPKLREGEKEIIALYHDECCYHAFDFKKSGWCAPVTTPTIWQVGLTNNCFQASCKRHNPSKKEPWTGYPHLRVHQLHIWSVGSLQ